MMSWIPSAIALSVFAVMTIAGAAAAEDTMKTEFTVQPDRIEFKKGAGDPGDTGGADNETKAATAKRVDKSTPLLMQGTDGGGGEMTPVKEMDKSSPQ
jgi:hypothetical protein